MLDQLKRDIEQVTASDNGGRSLALLILALSFGVVLYWYVPDYDIRLYALALLFLLGIVGAVKPHLFKLPYKWWMVAAVVIGFFVFRLFLLVVYLIAVVPIALFLRIVGKDLLSVQWDRQLETYWRYRPDQPKAKQMEDPF